MRETGMPKKVNNKGTTLVELITCFLLLGIFLIAVSVILTTSFRQYYHEMRTMSAYSVADSVLDEIKNDIRSMQASETLISSDGYIKLRNRADNKIQKTTEMAADGSLSGQVIEFVASNGGNGSYAEIIDTRGYIGALVQSHQEINSAIAPLGENYLTIRYFMRDPNEPADSVYAGRYVDRNITDTAVQKGLAHNGSLIAPEAELARGAEERLSREFYNGFHVDIGFKVWPKIYDASDYYVDVVEATVNVYEDENGNGSYDEEEMVYTKTRRIPLENLVFYDNYATLYSDDNSEVRPSSGGA